MSWLRSVALGACGLVYFAGCSSSKGSADGSCRGDERCACFGNVTCNPGLECHSGLCVNPEISKEPKPSAQPDAATKDGATPAAQASSDAGDPHSGGPEPADASSPVQSPTGSHTGAAPSGPKPSNADASSPQSSASPSGGAQPDAGTTPVASSAPIINPQPTASTSPPSCDEPPLVWIVLAKGSGMFAPTVVGETSAWDAVVDSLVGADGIVTQFGGNVHFGLTLFDGIAEGICPAFVDVAPATNADAIRTALAAVEEPLDKQESPLAAAYDAAVALVRARPEARKYILTISNSVPDFCNDGMIRCAWDATVLRAQSAYADDGIQTLVAGIEHPVGDLGGPNYFQALANAGVGNAVNPFFQTGELISCPQTSNGSYEAGSTASASYAYGSAIETGFAAELSTIVSAIQSCP